MIERELTCEVCDFPFTDEEWEHRHTADDGSDVHERCCLCDSPTVSTTGDLTLVRHDAHHPGSPTVEVPAWNGPPGGVAGPRDWPPEPSRARLVGLGALIGAAVVAAVVVLWERFR